jgi:hypothetical protein
MQSVLHLLVVTTKKEREIFLHTVTLLNSRSVAAKFEYKAFPKLAASTIESLYIRIYMVILWPNIEYGATK